MMHAVLAALAQSRPAAGTSCERLSVLLVSVCRLLASAPAGLVSTCSVSGSVSSPDQLQFLALEAERIAAEYGVVSTVKVYGDRLHVRFVRRQGELERVNEGE